MRRRERVRLTAIAAALTLAWLAGGTACFIHWQASEAAGDPVGNMVWPALEAALLVALVFWVLAGIGYGVIRWIVTGRGPQA